MPAGVNNPVLGYLGFCAVKFAGYSFAAKLLSSSYRRADRNAYVVGGARTLIGMAVGAIYYGIMQLMPSQSGVIFLAGLIPLRLAEWWLLIWLFYDRLLREPLKGWRCVAFGTIWSYILDVPALIGFLITGGMWIC